MMRAFRLPPPDLLLRAGWRSTVAPTLYAALRVAAAALLAAVSFWPALPGDHAPTLHVLLALVLASIGFGLPRLWLQRAIHQRQQAIRSTLPDLLDLLVLCTEAGLSLEQSFTRLGREFLRYAPALGQELTTLALELDAGRGRQQALQHFAVRLGLPEVHGLVSLLLQAERFGTRISDALVAQAEQVRRQQRRAVEKAAAVIGLKLLFPLVFCIFPGLLVVLVGPAFIGIYRALQV